MQQPPNPGFSLPAPLGFAHDGKNDSMLFKTDAQREAEARREAKMGNSLGTPIAMGAKVLHLARFKAHGLLFADASGACGILNNPTEEAASPEKIVLRGHRGPATCCVYAEYPGPGPGPGPGSLSTYLFSSGWDSTIRIWSLETRLCVRTLTIHDGYVKCLLVYLNKYLFSSGADAKIRRTCISDIPALTGASSSAAVATAATCATHRRGVEAMAEVWLGNRAYFATCSSDSTCRVWDPETLECVLSVAGHETNVCGIHMFDDQMYTASADRLAKSWSLCTDKQPWRAVEGRRLPHPEYVRTIVSLQNGSIVVTGSSDGIIRVWDLNNAAEPAVAVKEVEGHFDEVTDLCVVGSTLLSSSLDGTIRRWRIRELLDPAHKFKIPVKDESPKTVPSLLTAEEERELEDLLLLSSSPSSDTEE